MPAPMSLVADRTNAYSGGLGNFQILPPGLAQQPFTITPTGEIRFTAAPRQFFIDTWDTSIDTVNKWISSSGGGGVAPTWAAGGPTLNSGVTLNGFAALQSLKPVRLANPGAVLFQDAIQLETGPLLATGYRFWGSGSKNAAPTIAAPVIDGMGWEVTTGGVLTPVVYAGTAGVGTRIPAITRGVNDNSGLPTLTGAFGQITDGGVHQYYRWFGGYFGFWCIDGPDNVVAYFLKGAGGPNVNALPLLYECISNGSTAVTLGMASQVAGDTGKTFGSVLLDNGFTYDEQKSNTDTNTSLTVLAAQGTGTVNSADQVNVSGRGITVVINITVITAGTLTVTIQGKDIASGVYYTILASAALAATGTTVLTVYPAGVVTANLSANAALPRTWRVSSVVATGPVTATVGASVIL
jgi:hypothetical protein